MHKNPHTMQWMHRHVIWQATDEWFHFKPSEYRLRHLRSTYVPVRPIAQKKKKLYGFQSSPSPDANCKGICATSRCRIISTLPLQHHSLVLRSATDAISLIMSSHFLRVSHSLTSGARPDLAED